MVWFCVFWHCWCGHPRCLMGAMDEWRGLPKRSWHHGWEPSGGSTWQWSDVDCVSQSHMSCEQLPAMDQLLARSAPLVALGYAFPFLGDHGRVAVMGCSRLRCKHLCLLHRVCSFLISTFRLTNFWHLLRFVSNMDASILFPFFFLNERMLAILIIAI